MRKMACLQSIINVGGEVERYGSHPDSAVLKNQEDRVQNEVLASGTEYCFVPPSLSIPAPGHSSSTSEEVSVAFARAEFPGKERTVWSIWCLSPVKA